MFDTTLKKKRAIGLALLLVLLALFLSFNRFPKLDVVRADLDAATAPQAECFQGFCIEREPDSTFLTRWWDFTLTYLELVTVGMIFAFLVAGLTESFLFPAAGSRFLTSGGILKGTLKGLAIGPIWNLCSACIMPVTGAFRRRGASIEGTLAMIQGSSTLNLPAMIMVILVFTPMLGGSRIVLSIIGGLLIGPLVALVVGEKRDEPEHSHPSDDFIEAESASWIEVSIEGSKEWIKSSLSYLVRMGPIMVAAGFVSGLAIQWISPEVVTTYLDNDILGVAIAATFGLLINVPLLFEIPLVVLLMLLGMGIAPAATLLFAAAAGGPITFWGLAKMMPRRAIVTFATATWTVGVIGGIAVFAIGGLLPGTEAGIRTSVVSAGVDGTGVARGAVITESPKGDDLKLTEGSPESLLKNVSHGLSARVVFPDASGTIAQPEPVTPFINVTQEAVGRRAARLYNFRPAVVIFDYDRDGDLDFYITSDTTHANALHRNDGDGTFSEVAEDAGVSLVKSHSSGAMACDLNNDGYQDLYVGAMGIRTDGLGFRAALGPDGPARELREAIEDSLFVNNGDGTFTDITDSAFGDSVNIRSAGSIACGDVDGDGWLDIYVGNVIEEDFFLFNQPHQPGHYNLLYLNNGDLTFREVAEAAGVKGTETTMRNADGQAMLFADPDTGVEYEGYDPTAQDKEGNRVGDPTGRTHAVLLFDYDDDGDPDLWLANDGDRLQVFRNDSSPGEPRFTAVARTMGIDKVGNWMGFAVGDYDGDADLDVFVTNAGPHLRQREPQQLVGGDCKYTERFIWGTCLHFLLRNDGTTNVPGLGTVGLYHNVAPATPVLPSPNMPPLALDPGNIHPAWEVPTGLSAYDFGYGATFFDSDNDGDQDLYWLGSEANAGDGPGGQIYPAAGRMLRGDGRGSFEDITVRAHLLDIFGVDYSVRKADDIRANFVNRKIHAKFHENGKGVAHGDLNGDGYVDLIGTNSSGSSWNGTFESIEPSRGDLFVWINGGGSNHWITLRLKGRMAIDGTGTNADGIGARVYVKTKGDDGVPLVQVQEVRAGSSYISMDSIDLEFGVNGATSVEEILISWPSGREQLLKNVAVDRVLEIVEPAE